MEFFKLVVASQKQAYFKFAADVVILKVAMYLNLIE